MSLSEPHSASIEDQNLTEYTLIGTDASQSLGEPVHIYTSAAAGLQNVDTANHIYSTIENVAGENPVQVYTAISDSTQLQQVGDAGQVYTTAALQADGGVQSQQVTALKQVYTTADDIAGAQATIVQVYDPNNQDAVAQQVQQVFAQHGVGGQEGFTIQVYEPGGGDQLYTTTEALDGGHQAVTLQVYHDPQTGQNHQVYTQDGIAGQEAVTIQVIEPMESAVTPAVTGEDQQQIMTVQAVQVFDQENVDPQTQTKESTTPSKSKQKAVVKPPVGKGPFKCDICEKVFNKWNQLQRHIRTHEDDKPFCCTQCYVTFNVEENLRLHMAIHNVDDPTCPECHKKFSRVASLKAHLMMHEREENVMCAECGDEFLLQSQLDKHMQEHREEQEGLRVYPCKQCNQEFLKLALLREHMKQHYKVRSSLWHRTYKRHIDRSGFPHKCNHCGKSFQKPSQLQRHIRIHTGERPFKCHTCDKAFNQKGALQIHMSKHTGEKPHVCDFCPSSFAQKGNLRAHIQRVHNQPQDDAPVYHCEECSCIFKKLGSLNAHMSRVHSGPDLTASIQAGDLRRSDSTKTVTDVIQQLLELSEQVVNNPEATQQQIQQIAVDGNISSDILQQALENSGLTAVPVDVSALKSVEDITGNTDTTSNGVPNTTSTTTLSITGPTSSRGATATMTIHDSATGTIKRHLIRKVNGIRWHQCTYCTKEFKKPSDLVRHIRIHTHEKPYKCHQCFRAFAVKSTLTAHSKTHTGLKEFRCHACNKLFSTQGSLKVHLRLHTGAKPFDCPHCDKKFRTSGHRKSHIQSHFKDASPRKPRRPIRRPQKPEIELPDIPLQEPILITDTGLIQQQPRHNQMFTQYLAEGGGSVDRPYKCNYCSRGFKKSSHLKQHVRSHTGEKPYKCLQCLRAFVSSGVLKAHIRTHTGLKAYKCPVCDSTFTTNGSLKRHMSTHSEVRPFMCPYCQKTFKTSVNCKKHMKTHKQELAIQAMQSQSQASANVGVQSVDEDTIDGDVVTEDVHVGHHTEVEHLTQTLDPQQLQEQEQQTATRILQQQQQPPQDLIAGELTQELNQATLTQQTVIQDALVDTNLQTALNQQVYGQQELGASGFSQAQAFTQSILTGNDQQTFTQLNYSQAQFGLAPQNALDVNTLNNLSQQNTAAISTTLESTNMQNILQTREPELTPAQRNRQVMIQQEVEDGKRAHRCGYCDKAFKKSSHLKQHIRSHTGEKPYKCLQCGRMFVSTGVLKAHMRTHIGMKDYRCEICQASFTTNGSLTRHMMIHSSIRPFKCPYCAETFRTSVHCRRHMKQHREGGGSDEDESDGERLSRRSSRSTIIQITEEQAEELSKTTPDEEMTVSEKLLIQSAAEKDRISEMQTAIQELDEEEVVPVRHTRKSSKYPHACHSCPKSFKKPSDLVRHLRIHTGEKPFNCDICGRSFTVKSTLDSHMKTHTSGEKQFKCHVCNSKFSTKGSLKVHMRLHTGAKPFKCPHCEQRFRTSGHRKSHITSHFKPVVKKRKVVTRTVEPPSGGQPANLLGTDVQQQLGQAQVINIDQSVLQQGSVLPVSLSITDGLGNLAEGGLAAQVLQGLEGIQLQLTAGALGPGVQITGLEPSLLSQVVQIDASVLQQLQQGGNLNFSVNPNVISQGLAADPNLIQNVNVQAPAAMDQNLILQNVVGLTAQNGSEVIQEAVEATDMPQTVASFDVNTEAQADTLQSQVDTQPDEDDTENIDTETLAELDTVTADINLQTGATVKSASGDQERTHICPLCEKGFKRAGHLKEHMMIHVQQPVSRLKTTPHKCTTCGKAFGKPSQLERHIRIHTGERPFVCEICKKAFNQKNALQVHLKKHSGERPHRCPYCQLAFTQKGNLKTHIKRAHHLEMVQSMNLPKGAEQVDAAVLKDVAEDNPVDPADSVPPGEGLDLEGVVTDLFPQ